MYIFIFCFNDTATTEIYTYLHTLSLHDALPSGSTRRSCGPQRSGGRVRSPSRAAVPPELRAPGQPAWPARRDSFATAPGPRSEEHTSELQSLMRISYAVFCLKKKQ